MGLRARDNCAGEWLADKKKGWKFCGGFDTKIKEEPYVIEKFRYLDVT